MAFPRVRLITPPEALPVTLAEVKAHLRVEHDAEDSLIETYLQAAVSEIDGRDGIFYCLKPQVWRQEAAVYFSGSCISLPLGPVIEVVTVEATDGTGQTVVLDASAYDLIPAMGTEDAALRLNGSAGAGQAVAITYRAGAEVVPAPIRAAIMLRVADLYRFTDAQIEGAISQNPTVDALLRPYRRVMVA